MNIVVMGPVGSGKSTQAQLLARELGLPLLNMGDLLYFKSQEESPLGENIKAKMEKGEIVDDEIAINLVEEQLLGRTYKQGVVIDGFPRTLRQVERLKTPINKVFYLEVGDEENTRRLLARGRQDDTPELIAKRLKIYHQQTEPILTYYRQKGILEKINGERPIEAIFADIRAKIF